jgi:hypothetical protein
MICGEETCQKHHSCSAQLNHIATGSPKSCIQTKCYYFLTKIFKNMFRYVVRLAVFWTQSPIRVLGLQCAPWHLVEYYCFYKIILKMT